MALRSYVRWFRDMRHDAVPLIGKKDASLGELYSRLSDPGIKVTNGLVLTGNAHRDAGAWDHHRLAQGFALARRSMLALAFAALIAPAALARGGTVIVLTPPQPVYSPPSGFVPPPPCRPCQFRARCRRHRSRCRRR